MLQIGPENLVMKNCSNVFKKKYRPVKKTQKLAEEFLIGQQEHIVITDNDNNQDGLKHMCLNQ